MDKNDKRADEAQWDAVTPDVSLGKSVRVRGYELHRMPLGQYLRVTQRLQSLPQTLARACFPGMSAAQILEKLRRVDAQMLSELAVRAMLAAPQEAVSLLAACTGIDEDTLLADENIGLDGAAELAEACFELNRLGNFMQAAARLAAKAKTGMRGSDGSSA